MKMILIEDVKGLGKAGEVVNSKPGYARNYLLPNNLAIEATKENMKIWEAEQKEKRRIAQENLEEAEALKDKIEKTAVVIKAKVGDGDRLFGAITSKDIAEALEKQTGIVVDKRKIELKDNIKSLMKTQVPVRVYPELVAQLTVEVTKE